MKQVGVVTDSHSGISQEEAKKLGFPGMEVLFDYLPLAICCHTGEGALAVGCSCRPKR